MTMFLAPYTAIADIDGSPLDAGFLFFGEYGKDPEIFPVEVFWDSDFTVPAAQPIRTRNGYPVRNGSPTKVYLKTAQHSIVIKNRNGAFILVDFNNKGWSADFVVDGNLTQKEINDQRQISVKDYFTKEQLKDCLTGNPQLNYSDAFQAAVDDAIANGSHSIFIPFDRGEIYNLDKTVNLNASGFELKGNRAPTYFRQTNRRGYIRANSDVIDFFNYNNGAEAGVYLSNQLTVDGIAGIGRFGRTQNFLRHDTDNNGPHRGVLFTNSSFVEFDGVLPIVTRTAGYIGAGSVVFENGCVIQGCNYASKANSRSFNIRVAGIQSEQGAKWQGWFDGGMTFVDNMLEGQQVPIDIQTSGGVLDVKNNYFEAHTGDAIVKFSGSAAAATFNHHMNYFAHTDNVIDVYRLSGVMSINSNNVYNSILNRSSQITCLGLTTALNSISDGMLYVGTTSLTDGLRGYFSPKLLNQAPASAVSTNIIGTTKVQTPYGVNHLAHTFTGTSSYITLSKSFAAGDVIVACALVKVTGGDSPVMRLVNQDNASCGSLAQYGIPIANDGQWQIAVVAGYAPVAGTSAKINFTTTSGMTIAAVGVDVVPQSKFQTFTSVNGGITLTEKRAPIQVFNPLVNENPLDDYSVTKSVTIPSIPNGSYYDVSSTILWGVEAGDPVAVGMSVDDQGLDVHARVSSQHTVSIRIYNRTAAPINIGAATLKIKAFK